jgi:hypothetical protein
MLVQTRSEKVFTVALISVTIGAVILKILGHNPISAGAFSLSDYYRLEPIENVLSSRAVQTSSRWSHIEIYYSGTKAGNIEQLASLSGLASPENINCHFVICNGLGGGDGQIQPTEKWQEQWSIIPDPTQRGVGQTIRLCVIADGTITPPTDCQIKRTESLVEGLSKKFNIRSASIYYPDNWW